jgi:hypothetical protein
MGIFALDQALDRLKNNTHVVVISSFWLAYIGYKSKA